MNWMDFVSEQSYIIAPLVVLIILFIRRELAMGGEQLSAQQLVLEVNTGNTLLVDVRDKKEFDEGHIVDALNIPFAKLNSSSSLLDKHRDRKIIVVDKIGQHSGSAGKTLRAQGFEVMRLRGGIADWQQQNMPLVKN